MQCSNCRSENREGARFCDSCGARLAPDAASAGPAPAGASASLGGVAAVAGGVAVGHDVHGDVLINSTKIVYTGQDPEAAQKLLNRYLRWLIGECAPLRLKAIDQGAARPGAQPLGLTSVYVDLNLDFRLPQSAPSLKAWLAQRPAADSPADLEQSGESRLVTALEALAEYPRFVLLGAPGSGKSTLSLYLALSLAQAALGDQATLARLGPAWTHGPLLPVRVVLRHFAASLPPESQAGTAQHLWDYLAGEWRGLAPRGELEPLVRDLADKTGVLFLLDGLDEVGDANRRARVLEAVQAFAATAGRASRFLLTARPYAWEKPEQQIADFPAVHRLADFDAKQIAAFIERWYAAVAALGWVNATEATERTASLQTAVKRHDLRPLAQNPLLLTLMATLHSNRGRLPDDRADLYNEVVELLLQRWNEPSGADRGLLDALNVPSLKLADLRSVIERVAYEAHAGHIDQPGTADIPESRLLFAFRPLVGNSLDKAEKVVAYIENRAGLLLGQGARGAFRQFTFPHRTFQEFLAACYLASLEDLGVRAYELASVAPAHWAEVIKLAARRAGVSRGVAAADGLVRLSDVEAFRRRGKITDEWDWHRAALAGHQLLEVGLATLNSRDEYLAVRERVVDWLVHLVTEGALTPAERLEAGEVLNKLGDPRFDAARWYLPTAPDWGFVEVPAGPFRLGSDRAQDPQARDNEQPQQIVDVARFFIARYPVTVAQFKAFLDETGAVPRFAARDNVSAHHPVASITWHEARQYCDWLTSKLRGLPTLPGPLAEALSKPQWRVTLPSEAEWEKAARGGLVLPGDIPNPAPGRVYPWGDELAPDRANTVETGVRGNSLVGAFPLGASPYGLMDMSGNLWEWTRSLWGSAEKQMAFGYEHGYDPADGREALDAPDDIWRVVRGGSFDFPLVRARCAIRGRYRPDGGGYRLGFRVVIAELSPAKATG